MEIRVGRSIELNLVLKRQGRRNGSKIESWWRYEGWSRTIWL